MATADPHLLGCPSCHGPLSRKAVLTDEGRGPPLRCDREAIDFPVVDGIPRLIVPDRAGGVLAMSEEYSRVWRKDGWGATDDRYLLALPYRDTTGRASARWKVKARSLDALLRLLSQIDARTVVDLGCGIGWLSYRLSTQGFDVYAIDMVLDEVLGLGAAAAYVRAGASFHRIWGELLSPPFIDGSVDVVICNASLHYAPDLRGQLRVIGRMLRAGGSLIVMNSPVHSSAVSARRAEVDFQSHLRELGATDSLASSYHHFVESDLVAALEEAIGPAQEIAFDPGVWFRWRRAAKGIILRMELAQFPLLWARKPDDAAKRVAAVVGSSRAKGDISTTRHDSPP